MSYAETGVATSQTHNNQALKEIGDGKWASDCAHAYYALVKGEADLGELMEWAYGICRQRMNDSPAQVAGEWFNAIPAEKRVRYLPGGAAHDAYAQWQASLAD